MPGAKRETPERAKAYAYYVSLGDKRSLELVAQEFGVHVNTIKNWSRAHRWMDRIRKDEESIKGIIVQRTSQAVVKSAEEFKIGSMEFVDTALSKARSKLESGEVDLSRPGDIVNLMKMGLLLRGEATERRETVAVKAKENAMKILDLVRTGGDVYDLGPHGDIPVFAVAESGGDEAEDSERS